MARYEVGAVQYVTEKRDGAHVASVWEDTYADGSTEQYNVTWVLRKQENGWRIVGLATQPRPDAPEIFLNFENPAGHDAEGRAGQRRRRGGPHGPEPVGTDHDSTLTSVRVVARHERDAQASRFLFPRRSWQLRPRDHSGPM